MGLYIDLTRRFEGKGLTLSVLFILVVYSWRSPFRRCVDASQWNVEGGRYCEECWRFFGFDFFCGLFGLW